MLQNSIIKFIAQYYVELEGKVDAIVFTAGIGENGISLRANVVNAISRALDIKLNKEANSNIARFKKNQSGIISTSDSKIKVLVIPTNEEYMILKDTYEISQKVKSNEFVKKLLASGESWSEMWLAFGQSKYPYDEHFMSVSKYVKDNDIELDDNN